MSHDALFDRQDQICKGGIYEEECRETGLLCTFDHLSFVCHSVFSPLFVNEANVSPRGLWGLFAGKWLHLKGDFFVSVIHCLAFVRPDAEAYHLRHSYRRTNARMRREM